MLLRYWIAQIYHKIFPKKVRFLRISNCIKRRPAMNSSITDVFGGRWGQCLWRKILSWGKISDKMQYCHSHRKQVPKKAWQKISGGKDVKKFTFQEGKMSLTKVVRGTAKTGKAPYGAQFMENFKNFSSHIIFYWNKLSKYSMNRKQNRYRKYRVCQNG